MIEQFSRKSGELFTGGYCCAESVLMAVAEAKNINSDLIPRMASGFCSGMARTRGLCGAVSGAIMAINLSTGRNSPDQPHDDNYRLVQKLLSGFKEKFGSLNCWELTGCDLDTDQGQK